MFLVKLPLRGFLKRFPLTICCSAAPQGQPRQLSRLASTRRKAARFTSLPTRTCRPLPNSISRGRTVWAGPQLARIGIPTMLTYSLGGCGMRSRWSYLEDFPGALCFVVGLAMGLARDVGRTAETDLRLDREVGPTPPFGSNPIALCDSLLKAGFNRSCGATPTARAMRPMLSRAIFHVPLSTWLRYD
jgi:hypothetical protein